MMVLGIKERGTEATKMLKGVLGWEQDNGFALINLGAKQLIYHMDEVVCSVPSDGFDRSRTKPFLIDGYVNNEE